MIERGGGGSLVATSSTSAVSGTAGAANYAAAKAGVIAVLKSLAVEGARHRIRANAIIPGWIDTAFAGGMLLRPTRSRSGCCHASRCGAWAGAV